MAAKARKNKFVIRFELGLFGMFSLALVCFCIFLWMYLFGVWSGQTILKPTGLLKSPLTGFVAPDKSEEAEPAAADPGSETVAPSDDPEPSVAGWDTDEPSFFSLQIAAFRDPARAEKSVLQWRSRGYQAFAAPPEDKGDPFSRVYVGKFEKLVDANQLAARLEQQEKTKGFIALLPASRIRIP
ncbi:MAG: SPOR domain-containing protein [Desulfobulbaceae bacterium]|nr:SPOR domain-containing protein [Desulfobulbaceae bacterium]HIJ79568.1 hypothetical protein [Deltaproteobacteria bacterium]